MINGKALVAGIGVAIAAAPAHAKCPDTLTASTLRSWGGEVASRSSRRVYRPSGLQMLGQPVPYVLVLLDGKGAPSQALFRLGRHYTANSGQTAAALIKAFQREYGGAAQCTDSDCETVEQNPRKVGGFQYSALSSAHPFDRADDWSGPGAAALVADQAPDGEELTFQFCYYRSGDDD